MAALSQSETTEVKSSDEGINLLRNLHIINQYTEENEKAYYPNDRHLFLNSYYGELLTTETAKLNPDIKYFLSCYIKQQKPTTCALVTLNIIINAKQLSLYYHNNDENKDDDIDIDDIDIEYLRKHQTDSFRYIDEDEMIEIYPNYCDFKPITKLLESGLSLGQFEKMMIAFNFKNIKKTYCDSTKQEKEKETAMMDEFREKCMKLSMNHIMVCNYSLKRISKGTGNTGGHFSIIIAYHEQSDRVLVKKFIPPKKTTGGLYLPESAQKDEIPQVNLYYNYQKHISLLSEISKIFNFIK